MIEALTQAVRLMPSETRVVGDQLVCDSKYAKRIGEEAAPCGFVIFSLGPGQALLACTVHGNRLLAAEKHIGTSHENEKQRNIGR